MSTALLPELMHQCSSPPWGWAGQQSCCSPCRFISHQTEIFTTTTKTKSLKPALHFLRANHPQTSIHFASPQTSFVTELNIASAVSTSYSSLTPVQFPFTHKCPRVTGEHQRCSCCGPARQTAAALLSPFSLQPHSSSPRVCVVQPSQSCSLPGSASSADSTVLPGRELTAHTAQTASAPPALLTALGSPDLSITADCWSRLGCSWDADGMQRERSWDAARAGLCNAVQAAVRNLADGRGETP